MLKWYKNMNTSLRRWLLLLGGISIVGFSGWGIYSLVTSGNGSSWNKLSSNSKLVLNDKYGVRMDGEQPKYDYVIYVGAADCPHCTAFTDGWTSIKEYLSSETDIRSLSEIYSSLLDPDLKDDLNYLKSDGIISKLSVPTLITIKTNGDVSSLTGFDTSDPTGTEVINQIKSIF